MMIVRIKIKDREYSIKTSKSQLAKMIFEETEKKKNKDQ